VIWATCDVKDSEEDVVLVIKKAVEEATLAKDCLNGVVN
jgi:hypothetical protein